MACPTHELWITVTRPDGTEYSPGLIGFATINADGTHEMHYSAVPLPGAGVTMIPIEDPWVRNRLR